MIEPKFTKGPWKAFNMVHAERGDQMTPEEIGEYVANSVKRGSPDRFLFVSVTKPDGDWDICHVGNGPDGPANACLIAAAPELESALRNLLSFTLFLLEDPSRGEDAKAIHEAYAALAKARGEQ